MNDRDYLAIAACYLPVALLVGPWRSVTGVLPVPVLVSFVLWIPFAHLTHEGYSTGDPAARSHRGFGRLATGFSFGLPTHRAPRRRPHLGWCSRHFIHRLQAV